MTDLFEGAFGYASELRLTDALAAHQADLVLDTALRRSGALERLPGQVSGRRREVAVLIPSDPRRPRHVRKLVRRLEATRGRAEVTVDTAGGVKRYAKVNAWLAARSAPFDWLVVVDDDVELDWGFLDPFLDAAEAAGLVVAQPAHRIHSFASYAVTQRVARSVVRRTRFVEGGPVVAFSASVLPALAPFPPTRHGWGVDFLWCDTALRRGWRIGVVDAATVEHVRPVGAGDRPGEAVAEGRALLAGRALAITREVMLGAGEVTIGW